MWDPSRKWIILVICAVLLNVCFAAAPSPSPVTSQDTCSVNPKQNFTVIEQVSKRCCSDAAGTCASKHNGNCMLMHLTGSCDYTIDVCSLSGVPSKNCTCCGVCKEQHTNSQCKLAGGKCAKTCTSTEFHAGWFPCQNGCCKCCKKICEEYSCANGDGYCSSTGTCSKGSYPSTTETCKGFGCTCCVRCGTSKFCSLYSGRCYWKLDACPKKHFSSDKLCCPDPNCRCCYTGAIVSTPPECSIIA